MIRKGMRIFYKPEWMDAGDEDRTFVALADEVEGQATIPVAQPSPSFAPHLTPWTNVSINMIDRERTEAFNA